MKKATLVPLVCILALLAGAVGLQHRMIQDFRSQNPKYRDALYLPSSEYVRWVTLGYDQFMAEFLWLRMIQTFAAGWSRPENAAQMWSYFDTITDIDRKHTSVYSFAMMAMGEESRRSDLAYDVTDKSAQDLPYQFRIPFEGAFFAADWAEDPNLALYYLEVAGTDPQAPGYITRWKVDLHTKGGQYSLAFEKMLSDAVLGADPKYMTIYELKRRKLVNLLNDWWKWEIKQRAIKWEESYGFLPTVQQLDDAGWFAGLELPEVPRVLGLLEAVLAGQVDVPADELAIQNFAQSVIVKTDHLPYGPHDWIVDRALAQSAEEYSPLVGSLKGYVIWPSVEKEHDNFVMSRLEAAENLQSIATQARGSAGQYQQQHLECPPTFNEFMSMLDDYADPFGGEWVWFQDICDIGVTSFPEYLELNLPKY